MVIFLFIQPSISTSETEEMIIWICDHCCGLDHHYCYTVFVHNLPVPNTNIVGLNQIAIAQSLLNATSNQVFVLRLRDNTSDPKQKGLLNICVDSYSRLTDIFTEAFRLFNFRDYKKMASIEFDAAKQIDDCQTAFKSPTMTQRNWEMKELSNMAVYAAKLL
ncbi:unnamed protein product [Ilex paraguariensis]|uniref:Pectinesterase inhibitor domain-containing protein n=1 Tax=Ilex paraguariensis TaxID=185542 RepID=A0ABC8TL94_9AQUA